jgi:hypothetical protein
MNYPKQVIVQLFHSSGLREPVSGEVPLPQSPEAETLRRSKKAIDNMNYPKQVINQLFHRSGLWICTSNTVRLLHNRKAETLCGEIKMYNISKKMI